MPEWFDVLLPVSVGFAVVLVSILVLRLHAFFALILAALVTAALTSDEQLSWQRLEEVQLTISYFDEEGNGYGQHYFRPLFLKEAAVQEMEGGEFLPLSGAEQLIIYRPQAGGEPLVLLCQRIAYAGDITTPIGQQFGGYAFELPPGYVPHPNDVYALENDVQRVFAS